MGELISTLKDLLNKRDSESKVNKKNLKNEELSGNLLKQGTNRGYDWAGRRRQGPRARVAR